MPSLIPLNNVNNWMMFFLLKKEIVFFSFACLFIWCLYFESLGNTSSFRLQPAMADKTFAKFGLYKEGTSYICQG